MIGRYREERIRRDVADGDRRKRRSHPALDAKRRPHGDRRRDQHRDAADARADDRPRGVRGAGEIEAPEEETEPDAGERGEADGDRGRPPPLGVRLTRHEHRPREGGHRPGALDGARRVATDDPRDDRHRDPERPDCRRHRYRAQRHRAVEGR